jgi:hypothetical protein
MASTWGASWGTSWLETWGRTVAPPTPDAGTTGGGGWHIDFLDISRRIDEEREDREARRAELVKLYRKATGKAVEPEPEQVAATVEKLRAEQRTASPKQSIAIAERIRAAEQALVQVKAIAEIEASIRKLEQEAEELDVAYIVSVFA